MPTISRKVFADNPGAFSVGEFCLAFKISVPLFYKLLRLGLAPDSFNCGNRRLISYAAANRWAAQREIAAKKEAAAAR
jgi:hypothetical protein